MCGIAGIVDLTGRREVSPLLLERMAAAIIHRGPDEDGFLYRPGLGLASRRLSIVGLADGRQPIFNEDKSVVVVFNGELFDYIEKKKDLESRGHVFKTSCDTEVLVHLWEEHGEAMLPMLRGQFAFALYDFNKRVLILARDRIGICPLHWARRGDWIYFGSEIKAILASGQVAAEVDPRGIDHIFMMFAMPTRRTAFKDISAVYPASYLKIDFNAGELASVTEKTYWDLDFPDKGDEYDPGQEKLVEEFGAVFERAVEIRLRADVPVVSYLSGGVDSTSVLSAATRVRGGSLPTFTIQITEPSLDETDRAMLAAKTLNCPTNVIVADSAAITDAYPKLVTASESPVMDTSCAALYCLAGEVRRQNYKVALTGEGADEALAGYPWFKVNRLLNSLDMGPIKPGNMIRRLGQRILSPDVPRDQMGRVQTLLGGAHACADLYGLISMSRFRFYRPDFFSQLEGHLPYEDLQINRDRMKRWHPLNQSLYLGYKTILPGLLMNHKGDRPAMNNSVETRYPFLDEEFVAFCAKVHPRWKLKGLRRDKHLLRTWASKTLPETITNRPKAMFRAPFANTFFENPPPFVNQLLSPESLKKTGYFAADEVAKYRGTYRNYGWFAGQRLTLEMGLTGVMATQLWHHIFLGGGLCDLPQWQPPQATAPMPATVN